MVISGAWVRGNDLRWLGRERYEQWRSLPAGGRSDLRDELDDPAGGATVRIQVRVIDRQAPAGAAAAVQSRHYELCELLPCQATGQHDLPSSDARCELATRQDIEVDMQPPARRIRRDVFDGHARVASWV